MYFLPLTCSRRGRTPLAALVLLLGFGCSTEAEDKRIQEILHGTIAYPFQQTQPLGYNRGGEKFVIRTIVGQTEYTVEIPNAGQDYDIEVPLAALGGEQAPDRLNLAKASVTDREMVNQLPKIEDKSPQQTGFLDKAFGVSKKDGPDQAPSYTMGLAKVKRFYRTKKFEYALIEANHMLSFYPNSPKLHKMKGSILIRLNNLKLAQVAWSRALELAPKDKRLKLGLTRLAERIAKSKDP